MKGRVGVGVGGLHAANASQLAAVSLHLLLDAAGGSLRFLQAAVASARSCSEERRGR